MQFRLQHVKKSECTKSKNDGGCACIDDSNALLKSLKTPIMQINIVPDKLKSRKLTYQAFPSSQGQAHHQYQDPQS